MIMASEPKAKEQYYYYLVVVVSSSAARTNCDYIDDGDDCDDVINHDVALHPFFQSLIFWCRFGFELRILTPYRVGTILKTLIFGLDTTINR